MSVCARDGDIRVGVEVAVFFLKLLDDLDKDILNSVLLAVERSF